MRIFISETRITGIEAEVTDELRLLVAASAVTLSVGWPGYEWDQLTEVLLYPHSFDRDYSFESSELAGQAHPWGTVILSIPALRESFADPDDAYHVGIHEFAHLLELDTTRFSGIPPGLAPARSREWVELMEREMERLRRHVDWLIAEGVHGLIPSGSAGEFLQLTDAEREGLIRVTVEQAAGRVPVVAGATADGTAQAQRWARLAQDVGADGVMVAPPFYSLPTEDEVVRHYEVVAGSTTLPVMAYNNPATTGIDMRPRLIQRLAEIPNVRYVKESTTDVRRVEDIHRRTEGRMTVFAGIHALESFLVGAKGWVSVPANVAPKLSSRLYDSVVRGDLGTAREISERLWDLMELEAETGKYVQVYKEALALEGDSMGDPRGPRLPLTELERALLRGAMMTLRAPLGSVRTLSAR